MSNSLFHQLRAAVDVRSAADSSLRVRDLVATGQVTQHVADSSVTSYEEPQGCGDPEMHPGAPCPFSSGNQCITDPEDTRYNPFLLCDTCFSALEARGAAARATTASPVVTSCDISEDEQAEQDAAERAFLRSFGLGTWLSSQPTRFRYASSAYRGSSR